VTPDTLSYVIGPPPFEAYADEPYALDYEIYNQGPRLHRPDGDFALLSIAARGQVYVSLDKQDARTAAERMRAGRAVMHNALYDLRYHRQFGFPQPDDIADTLLLERVKFNGLYNAFGLDDLARRHLGLRMNKSVRDRFVKGDAIDDEMIRYAAFDAVVTLEVFQRQLGLNEGSDDDRQDFRLFEKIEKPMISAILDMPPIRLESRRWLELAKREKAKALRLERELGFNPRSPVQVRDVLMARHGLTLESTAEKVIEKFRNDYPEIEAILDCRGASRNASTYGENWIEEFLEDGYVYAGWSVIGASTSRMSSSEPNLQNIPVRKTPEYRECFIASPNHNMVSVDVSQQEPRVLAYLSGDKGLLANFQTGKNCHLLVAEDVYGRPVQKDEDEYKFAKSVNLGIGYGLTPEGLVQRSSATLAQAEYVIHRYFERYPGVPLYINRYRRFAKEHGFTRSPTGRRIYINPYIRKSENNAINNPIQCGAAEATKLAVGYFHRECQARGWPYRIVALVHDEVVADVPNRLTKPYVALIQECLRLAANEIIPDIPFGSDYHIGSSWSEV
jgi:DNA polymerase-1